MKPLMFFLLRKSTPLFFLSVIILFTACKKDSQDTNAFDPSVEKILINELYGTGNRQVADVHLPANRNANTKVVILLHGGGWSDGDKEDMQFAITLIRSQWPEAAIVNANYRLADNTPANYHPAQMNDINTLVNYIRENKNLWHISGDFGIVGVSAGAHLGLLYSYAYNNANHIKAVASVVGPTNFSDPFYTDNPLFQLVAKNYLGKTWLEDADLHRSVSPALRITGTSPPTFMAYGGLDPIVPFSNATTLRDNLVGNNIPNTLIAYENEGHEFSPASIQSVSILIVTFLKNHL
jgi:acetyl esterase/lipase